MGHFPLPAVCAKHANLGRRPADQPFAHSCIDTLRSQVRSCLSLDPGVQLAGMLIFSCDRPLGLFLLLPHSFFSAVIFSGQPLASWGTLALPVRPPVGLYLLLAGYREERKGFGLIGPGHLTWWRGRDPVASAQAGPSPDRKVRWTGRSVSVHGTMSTCDVRDMVPIA